VTTYNGNGATLADTAINTSTAYRYHRILFEGDTAGGSVSEIEFYDANGDKIDASDTNNAGNSINSNATQGLDHWTAFNGTRGGSDYSQGVRKDAGVGSAGFFISKDWGSGNTKIIYGVKVWGVNSYGLAGNTAGRYMKLQGSNNNSDWTDLQTWNEARYGTSWTTSSSTEVGHISDQTNSITTLNFNSEPDLIWIKNRDDSSQGAHRLFDTVRGSNKTLYPSFDLVEAEVANSLNSFNFNGFTVGSGNWVNGTNDEMVAWSWKAGGKKGTFNVDGVGYASAAAAGFGGSATITGASVGTKQGFGIIKYTGTGGNTTVGHNLGKSPSFIVIKCIETERGDAWRVWHTSLDANERLVFSDTNARGSASTLWQNTLPTSTVFYLDSDNRYNSTGDDHIAYLWCNVPGLQKFGSYIGNGASDGGGSGGHEGPFIELGFRPALIWIKNADVAADWMIHDTKRSPYNTAYKSLKINESAAENGTSTLHEIDILSNGFRIRNGDAQFNTVDKEYVYCAFAEAPSIDLYGGGANAR
jgi:hypothetical protein